MLVGARSDEIRKQNIRFILAALRNEEQASRTLIVEKTGLSAATVSTISSILIDRKVLKHVQIENGNDKASRRGRPRVSLTLNPEAGCIIVMSISMNKLYAEIQDYTGFCIANITNKINTLQIDMTQIKRLLIKIVRNLVRKISIDDMPLRCIAVGVQGVVDSDGSQLLWSPITALRNLPISDILSHEFSVPVKVANDCNMITEALHRQHPDCFGDSFVTVLLGQGVGMGLMLNGKRFIGSQSSAGEFGHLVHMPDGARCRCGQQGCIEAYVGDYAIWRRANHQAPNAEPIEDLDPKLLQNIQQRARKQSGIERTAYRESGEVLGHGLRSLFALIDPMPVVFVGTGTLAFDLMKGGLDQAYTQSTNAPKLNFSIFSDAEKLLHAGCSITALQSLDRQFSLLT